MPVETLDPPNATKPRRGRPALLWLSLAEVAEELGLDAEFVARLLEILPGSMPGAERHDTHRWVVPSTTVRALKQPRKGIELIQEATIEEVAEAMRKGKSTVHRLCTQRGPDGEGPQLKARKVHGEWLIDVRSIYELPAKQPSWAAPLFLQSKRNTATAAAEEEKR